jgi:hypothetical protein
LEPIPASVEQFLRANIDSVDQLEILRIVVGDPTRPHDVHALTRTLQIPPADVEQHVKLLGARGLVTLAATGPLACQHGSQTGELRNQVEALVQLYLQRPVTLIKMVYEKPKDQLKSFVDAFRLKKEK